MTSPRHTGVFLDAVIVWHSAVALISYLIGGGWSAIGMAYAEVPISVAILLVIGDPPLWLLTWPRKEARRR